MTSTIKILLIPVLYINCAISQEFNFAKVNDKGNYVIREINTNTEIVSKYQEIDMFNTGKIMKHELCKELDILIIEGYRNAEGYKVYIYSVTENKIVAEIPILSHEPDIEWMILPSHKILFVTWYKMNEEKETTLAYSIEDQKVILITEDYKINENTGAVGDTVITENFNNEKGQWLLYYIKLPNCTVEKVVNGKLLQINSTKAFIRGWYRNLALIGSKIKDTNQYCYIDPFTFNICSKTKILPVNKDTLKPINENLFAIHIKRNDDITQDEISIIDIQQDKTIGKMQVPKNGELYVDQASKKLNYLGNNEIYQIDSHGQKRIIKINQ